MRDAQTVAALRAVLADDRAITDPDIVGRYVHDEAAWAPHGTPAAVACARTAEDVATAVRVCAQLAVPAGPRGAGTGLSGGNNALNSCVMISTPA